MASSARSGKQRPHLRVAAAVKDRRRQRRQRGRRRVGVGRLERRLERDERRRVVDALWADVDLMVDDDDNDGVVMVWGCCDGVIVMRGIVMRGIVMDDLSGGAEAGCLRGPRGRVFARACSVGKRETLKIVGAGAAVTLAATAAPCSHVRLRVAACEVRELAEHERPRAVLLRRAQADRREALDGRRQRQRVGRVGRDVVEAFCLNAFFMYVMLCVVHVGANNSGGWRFDGESARGLSSSAACALHSAEGSALAGLGSSLDNVAPSTLPLPCPPQPSTPPLASTHPPTGEVRHIALVARRAAERRIRLVLLGVALVVAPGAARERRARREASGGAEQQQEGSCSLHHGCDKICPSFRRIKPRGSVIVGGMWCCYC